MCGICGKIHTDSSRKVTENVLREMTDTLRHRGPDDEGFFIQDNVGLGFRRLSIIDLNTGHQPIANENETIWIILNGEIYNFLELRKRLERLGHVFKTRTDTECIIHLYEEYDTDCVDYLRGMFAFAIWDSRKHELFCARDRFGIKPFYYAWDGSCFVFASELKAILRNKEFRGEIDLGSLDSYFAYGYMLHDATFFSGIQKLPPAHTLRVNPSKHRTPIIKRYWDFQFRPDHSKTEMQWSEEIGAALAEAVRLHTVSDVPIGAFLSGGLDSSSVVALLRSQANIPLKTFSIGFQEAEFNELGYAREIAHLFGTEHHEQILEPESVGLLPRLVEAYDEPFADSSAIPTYYVSKFAREFVKVVLSGDGGDELFGGYDQYPKLAAIRRFNLLPDPVNSHLWSGVNALIPHKVKGKGITYLLSKRRDLVGAHLTIFNQIERRNLYREEIYDQLCGGVAERVKENLLEKTSADEYVSRLQDLDMRTYLVDDILKKVDIASMMNSLEVRVPLLDHELVELVLQIPVNYRFRNGVRKYALKQAMKGRLPESILQHRKQGFGVPLKVWFKKDLRSYVGDRLNSSHSPLSEYLDMRSVRKTVDDHNSGMRDFNSKLWTILFFDAWLEQRKKYPAK